MSAPTANFGASLRVTREKLGWSLQDVAHRTRIPLATLRQLEDNDHSHFPSLSYAKSFLAQYTEHLGIDASDFLDDFETGDPLANLDAYEYLKDHDEHVDAAPLSIKREKPKQEKVRKEKRGSSRPASLQPLLVFSVTALLITGAVFGFMKLSAQFSDDTPNTAAEDAPEEALGPVAGLLEGRPPARTKVNTLPAAPEATPVSSENLVAGNPTEPETLNAAPASAEQVPGDLSFESSPPPRAVIVEE